jgi:hypothetical protein
VWADPPMAIRVRVNNTIRKCTTSDELKAFFCIGTTAKAFQQNLVEFIRE